MVNSLNNQDNRVRKTVSFKINIYNHVDKLRGGKAFSTFLNEFLEETFNLKGGKKAK